MKQVKFKTNVGKYVQGSTESVGNKSAHYFARRNVVEILGTTPPAKVERAADVQPPSFSRATKKDSNES